jgi:phospholipase C
MANQLAKIDFIVHLMLENRSFDQMLGFLYTDSGNRSPTFKKLSPAAAENLGPALGGQQAPAMAPRPMRQTEGVPYVDPTQAYGLVVSDTWAFVRATMPSTLPRAVEHR